MAAVSRGESPGNTTAEEQLLPANVSCHSGNLVNLFMFAYFSVLITYYTYAHFGLNSGTYSF